MSSLLQNSHADFWFTDLAQYKCWSLGANTISAQRHSALVSKLHVLAEAWRYTSSQLAAASKSKESTDSSLTIQTVAYLWPAPSVRLHTPNNAKQLLPLRGLSSVLCKNIVSTFLLAPNISIGLKHHVLFFFLHFELYDTHQIYIVSLAIFTLTLYLTPFLCLFTR